MSNRLFQPVSPLAVWFWFMELLAALCIIGYWIRVSHYFRKWQMEHNFLGVYAAGLFVVSGILLFRYRTAGRIGSVISWFLIALACSIL